MFGKLIAAMALVGGGFLAGTIVIDNTTMSPTEADSSSSVESDASKDIEPGKDPVDSEKACDSKYPPLTEMNVTPMDQSHSQYAVSLGQYNDIDSTIPITTALRNKYLGYQIIPAVDDKCKTIYVVTTGEFDTQQDATNLASKLNNLPSKTPNNTTKLNGVAVKLPYDDSCRLAYTPGQGEGTFCAMQFVRETSSNTSDQ